MKDTQPFDRLSPEPAEGSIVIYGGGETQRRPRGTACGIWEFGAALGFWLDRQKD